MTQKDLRRMSKEELIRIICVLQNSENALQAEREQLEEELQQKRIPLQNAGSLVDCGEKVMELLRQAQEQAEQEAQIRREANADSALYAEAVVKQAKVRAEKMIWQAKQDAAGIQLVAEQAIAQYIKDHRETDTCRAEETPLPTQPQEAPDRQKAENERLREIYKRSRASSAMG